jgi:hypothetical protein
MCWLRTITFRLQLTSHADHLPILIRYAKQIPSFTQGSADNAENQRPRTGKASTVHLGYRLNRIASAAPMGRRAGPRRAGSNGASALMCERRPVWMGPEQHRRPYTVVIPPDSIVTTLASSERRRRTGSDRRTRAVVALLRCSAVKLPWHIRDRGVRNVPDALGWMAAQSVTVTRRSSLDDSDRQGTGPTS